MSFRIRSGSLALLIGLSLPSMPVGVLGWILPVAATLTGMLAMALAYQHLQSRAAMIGFVAGACAAPLLVSLVVPRAALPVAAGLFAAQMLVWSVLRASYGRPVLHDGTLCLQCAYDLTANVSGRCPECGGAVTR